MEEKNTGPLTSLQENDGTISDSKGGGKGPLSGLGGIVIFIIALLTVIPGIANSLGWHGFR